MSDLNPSVFQAQETCQCACEKQADLLTSLRDLHKSLVAKCPGVEIEVGFRVGAVEEYYFAKVGAASYVFGPTLEEMTAKANKIADHISSLEYTRALALQKEAAEILARLQ